MFVTTAEAKKYMRIEFDDEDNLIESLIIAAEEDAKSYIGIEDLDSLPNPHMTMLGIKYLVSHWYENRTPVTGTVMREVPLTVQRLWGRERTIPI